MGSRWTCGWRRPASLRRSQYVAWGATRAAAWARYWLREHDLGTWELDTKLAERARLDCQRVTRVERAFCLTRA